MECILVTIADKYRFWSVKRPVLNTNKCISTLDNEYCLEKGGGLLPVGGGGSLPPGESALLYSPVDRVTYASENITFPCGR